MNSKKRPFALALLMGLTARPACKTSGEYVWADEFPRHPRSSTASTCSRPVTPSASGSGARTTFEPQPGAAGRQDLPALRPRGSGRRVHARCPLERIQASLKDLIVNPVVTVTLDEPRPLHVSVLGEVARPGIFPPRPEPGRPPGDRHGGRHDAVRQQGRHHGHPPAAGRRAPQRIRFTYAALTQIKGRAAAFRLQGGDVVVVE